MASPVFCPIAPRPLSTTGSGQGNNTWSLLQFLTTSLPLLMTTTIIIATTSPTPVNSQMVIPRRALGFVYNNTPPPKPSLRSETVTLTAYMDLTCPDSEQAYPTLLELADKLSDSTSISKTESKTKTTSNSHFQLVFVPFSLPYHRNSHVLTEAAHIVDEYTGGSRVFPFITSVYTNIGSLVPSATANMTDYQVIYSLLAPIVNKSAHIPPTTFKQKIQESSYDMSARQDFKYACTRGIYSTPTFMVNDVVVNASPAWTVDKWLDLIKPLL